MLDSVHIATGGAAGGSLRVLCKGRQADTVVELVDPLAIGPLHDMDLPGGLATRKSYLRSLHERIGELALYDDLKDRVGLPELGIEMPDAARAIVWCGPNADEQLMLRAACARWRNGPLYQADVGSVSCGNGPRHAVGACTIDELRAAEQGIRLLSGAVRAALAADWERLLRTGHLLRVLEDDEIVGCAEDFFDSLLLAACPREFASAAQVVGQVMGQSPHLIGDTFLDSRLRELIASGAIEADDARLRLGALRVRRSLQSASH